jgi:hypothetical protein
MDHSINPMVISGFFELGGPITVDEVRATLEERLLVHHRFGMRPVPGRWGRPVWEAHRDFDLARHVGASNGEELQAIVNRMAAGMLDRNKPLWEMEVVEGDPGAIVVSLHHSIADGVALMQVLLSLCERPDRPPPTENGDPPPRRAGPLSTVAAAARLALLRPDPPTVLKSALSGSKQSAWSSPMPLETLRESARSHGVTVNDLLLAAVTGALRLYLSERGELPTREIRSMVPFNLRPLDVDGPLGNRFGLVLPSLPVTHAASADRLRRVAERMRSIKSSGEATAAYAIISAMGWSAAIVERALVSFFARKASAVTTNVPGPSDLLTFAGVPIERVVFWVPQAGAIGLGFSLMSYRGSVTVGVLSDTAVVPDPARLVADVEAELAAF